MIRGQFIANDVGSEEKSEMNLRPLVQVAWPDGAGGGPRSAACDVSIIVFLRDFC
jgi:hypothetical protein